LHRALSHADMEVLLDRDRTVRQTTWQGRAGDLDAMLKMNFWDAKWDLDEAQCPCDIHFNQWIEANKISGKTIYHFGTGTHHIVGLTQAANGSDNAVFAITASTTEYDAYIKLAMDQPQILKRYLAYFGDGYLTTARLLPEIDIATMFHAGEYIGANTTSPEYGGIDDLGLARILLERMRPDGRLLFYTGSFAFDKADALARVLEGENKLVRNGMFKSLLVCRKTG
jgi:hypothetical protein